MDPKVRRSYDVVPGEKKKLSYRNVISNSTEKGPKSAGREAVTVTVFRLC